MGLKIVPYDSASESAKELANLLGAKRVKPDSSTYVPRHMDYAVNWGSSRSFSWASRASARSVKILNKPEAVNNAANKLSAFQIMQSANINVPDFTTDMSRASRWLRSGDTVVERHELRGNSGAGIRIVNLDDDQMASSLQRAPLYTKFMPKTNEFRVHVFRGEVIDYIEKKKMASENRPANFSRYISSLEHGWVFARNNVRDIPEVKQIAVAAVRALGLDFGAVDVMFVDGMPYVLEVNSAPGLRGTTLVKYANAIRRYMGLTDLSSTVTDSLVDRVVAETQATRVVSQPRASADRQQSNDSVTLTLDRATAMKLRALLASF